MSCPVCNNDAADGLGCLSSYHKKFNDDDGVERWPDGRPKTRPGFNADVWNGKRPLTIPENRPLEVGDWVEFREPVDADGKPVRRGIVADEWMEEDTGEQQIIVVIESSKFGVRRYWRTKASPASDVDRARTIYKNQRTIASFVARVLAELSRQHANGEAWTGWDLLLLGTAQHLATLTDDQKRVA